MIGRLDPPFQDSGPAAGILGSVGQHFGKKGFAEVGMADPALSLPQR